MSELSVPSAEKCSPGAKLWLSLNFNTSVGMAFPTAARCMRTVCMHMYAGEVGGEEKEEGAGEHERFQMS